MTEGSTGVRKLLITTTGILEGNNSLTYAIKNPLTFIYNPSPPTYDWYTTVESYMNGALWGDGGEKSAYDPCPKGWRVPTYGTWDDLTYVVVIAVGQSYAVANGCTYRDMVWLPATGFRLCTDGSLVAAGGLVGFTTSTPNGARIRFWNYVLSGAYTTWSSNQALGYSVRCVQE